MNGAIVHGENFLTEICDGGHIMAYKKNRPAMAGDILHFAQAFFLEFRVSDGQNLVHDQNLGLQMRRDGEREPHIHPGAIPLHRRVDIPRTAGELDNLIELPRNLGLPHAQDRAVQKDVLPPRQFRMEPRADL